METQSSHILLLAKETVSNSNLTEKTTIQLIIIRPTNLSSRINSVKKILFQQL